MSSINRTISPSIKFHDAAFDPAFCEKFCLVLQAGDSRLTLAVLDNLSNDFLAFEQYVFRKADNDPLLAEQLQNVIAGHEWLTNGFKRVDALVVSERFTLVPAALFDSQHAKDYLAFNQPLDTNDAVLVDMLRNAEARNIYAIDASLEKMLKKISPAVRIRHHLSPLIERTLSVTKNKEGRRVFAHVRQGNFDLVISESGNLLLANTYKYQTSEDFIYFLLYATEQLKMNPETMELEIAGEVAEDSAIAGLAKKYVRQVRFADHPVEARFAKGFEQFPDHFHYDLFAAHYYS
ncbi:MAG TPA: DUF3822 family protein [Bacteroidia bacterium]|nr:DUF3822 family protein [Bacteroidia bacterium]